MLVLDVLDDVRPEPVAEIADRPDEPEEQRRQGQQREEARLGGQPGHAVAEADRRGLPGQGARSRPGRVPGRPVRPRNRPARCARSPRPQPSTVGHVSAPTHEVTNQPPPLVGHDVFAADAALVEAVRGTAGRLPLAGLSALGRRAGSRGGAAVGGRGQREPADAAHARPLRPPGRRGRLPPVLARAARGGRLGRAARRPVVRRRAVGAPAAGGRVRRLVAGRGRARLPGLDDVRRGPGAARRPGAVRGSGSRG